MIPSSSKMRGVFCFISLLLLLTGASGHMIQQSPESVSVQQQPPVRSLATASDQKKNDDYTQINLPYHNNDTQSNSDYVAYAMPPFHLTLTTINTLDMTNDGTNTITSNANRLTLERTAHALRRIVGQFVQESFFLQVAELLQKELNGEDVTTQDDKLPNQSKQHENLDILLDFVGTDLRVSLIAPHGNQEDDDNFHIQLHAEFHGVAWFIRPHDVYGWDHDHDDNPHILANSTARGILGAWLDKYLLERRRPQHDNRNNDNDLLLLSRMQAETSQPLLHNGIVLEIQTNVADEDLWNDDEDGNNGGGNGNDSGSSHQDNNDNGAVLNKDGVTIALVIVICLALLVLAALMFRYSYPKLFSDANGEHNQEPDNHHNSDGILKSNTKKKKTNSMTISKNNSNDDGHVSDNLPGRGHDGDDDSSSVSRQSDLWLEQHRPDLFNAVQKVQQQQQQQQQQHPFDESLSDNTPRRLSLTQQFWSGLFRNDGSDDKMEDVLASAELTQEQLEQSDAQPRDVALDDSIVFYDEEDPPEQGGEHDEEHDHPNGNGGWWNHLLTNLQSSIPGGSQHNSNRNATLACDEDPNRYGFAFQDFPRHDGTPCLIYANTAATVLRDRTFSGSNGSSHHSSRPLSPTNMLSNEEFKKVLSLNSEDGGIRLGSDGEEDDEEEEILYATPDFTDKLERLIAMRHRHYERQNILFKHNNKKRAEEEKKQQQQQQQLQEEEEGRRIQQLQEEAKQLKLEQEARQRELKLRRHEMELDMNEIEAPFSSRAARASSSEYGGSSTAIAVVTPLKNNPNNNNSSNSNAIGSMNNGSNHTKMMLKAGNSSANNLHYFNHHPSNGDGLGASSHHKGSASDPDLYTALALSSSSSNAVTPGGGGATTQVVEPRRISDRSDSSHGVDSLVHQPQDDPPVGNINAAATTTNAAATTTTTRHRKQTSSMSSFNSINNNSKHGGVPAPRHRKQGSSASNNSGNGNNPARVHRKQSSSGSFSSKNNNSSGSTTNATRPALHRKQDSSSSYSSTALATALSNTNKSVARSPMRGSGSSNKTSLPSPKAPTATGTATTRRATESQPLPPPPPPEMNIFSVTPQTARTIMRRGSEPRRPSSTSIFSSPPPPAIRRNVVSPDEWSSASSPPQQDEEEGDEVLSLEAMNMISKTNKLLDKSSKPKIAGRQRSHRGSHRVGVSGHRRSSSHGTGEMEASNHSLYQQQNGDTTRNEDVLTFGIAAYTTNFGATGKE